MKAIAAFSFCVCFVALIASAEECDYSMKKMCDFVENATYTERGCWYYCRIKAEFEVFTGTRLNGSPCKSIIGNSDGICHHGICFPNE